MDGGKRYVNPNLPKCMRLQQALQQVRRRGLDSESFFRCPSGSSNPCHQAWFTDRVDCLYSTSESFPLNNVKQPNSISTLGFRDRVYEYFTYDVPANTWDVDADGASQLPVTSSLFR